MSLKPQDSNTILTTMINHMAANTNVSDFNVGSLVRTMFEAVTLVIDEVYFQLVQMLNGFYINSATGSDLDKRLSDFGLQRYLAQPSTLTLSFSSASGTPAVPVGTICTVDSTDTTPSLSYVTIADGVAGIGGGPNIPAVCTTAGAVGNLPTVSFSSWTVNSIPFGVTGVTNTSLGYNGFDQEPDSQFRSRGISFLSSLPRGTNSAIVGACLNAVNVSTSSPLGITQAFVLENYSLTYSGSNTQANSDLVIAPLSPFTPASLVGPTIAPNVPQYGGITVVVDNGLGTLPFSVVSSLVPIINGDPSTPTLYPGYRASGIQVWVTRPAILTPATITLNLKLLKTVLDVASTLTACETAMSTFTSQIPIGGTLYMSDIITQCMAVPGVVDVSGVVINGHDVNGNLPATNVATKITLGGPSSFTFTTSY